MALFQLTNQTVFRHLAKFQCSALIIYRLFLTSFYIGRLECDVLLRFVARMILQVGQQAKYRDYKPYRWQQQDQRDKTKMSISF